MNQPQISPKTWRGLIVLIVVGLHLLATEGRAGAEDVRVSTRDGLIAALGRAKPGTTILLAPGSYRGGIVQAKLRGEEGTPVVIASENPKQPASIEGGGSGIHLSAPAFVELRNLVFDKAEANGLNIDDGGANDSPARGVVLSGLVVKNDAPRGNRDGIKLSGLDDFRVENCTVERWGTSGSGIDMVGCHDGAVVGCVFRHSGADFANGVQLKGGSARIVVRRCRFENAGGRAINIGGSTGLPHFRPKPQGYEAKEITIEDCTIVGSMAAIAFVGADGATVRHNTIYRPTKWVLRILQENQGEGFVACRNGRFENNLVAFRSDEVRTVVNVGGGTAAESFHFSGNAWTCLDRRTATRDLVRLPVKETDGVYGIDPRFRAAEKGDLEPADRDAVKAGARNAMKNE